MVGEKVNLTGARETLLLTLYGKALESRLPHSLLEDRFADEAVRKIDYDFSRLKVDCNLGIGLAMRAKTLDVHVQDFFARNPDAIVLHLGCGLGRRGPLGHRGSARTGARRSEAAVRRGHLGLQAGTRRPHGQGRETVRSPLEIHSRTAHDRQAFALSVLKCLFSAPWRLPARVKRPWQSSRGRRG